MPANASIAFSCPPFETPGSRIIVARAVRNPGVHAAAPIPPTAFAAATREMFDDLGYEIELIEGINPLGQGQPRRVRNFGILNSILLNQIEDMRYLQFAVVARPKS